MLYVDGKALSQSRAESIEFLDGLVTTASYPQRNITFLWNSSSTTSSTNTPKPTLAPPPIPQIGAIAVSSRFLGGGNVVSGTGLGSYSVRLQSTSQGTWTFDPSKPSSSVPVVSTPQKYPNYWAVFAIQCPPTVQADSFVSKMKLRFSCVPTQVSPSRDLQLCKCLWVKNPTRTETLTLKLTYTNVTIDMREGYGRMYRDFAQYEPLMLPVGKPPLPNTNTNSSTYVLWSKFLDSLDQPNAEPTIVYFTLKIVKGYDQWNPQNISSSIVEAQPSGVIQVIYCERNATHIELVRCAFHLDVSYVLMIPEVTVVISFRRPLTYHNTPLSFTPNVFRFTVSHPAPSRSIAVGSGFIMFASFATIVIGPSLGPAVIFLAKFSTCMFSQVAVYADRSMQAAIVPWTFTGPESTIYAAGMYSMSVVFILVYVCSAILYKIMIVVTKAPQHEVLLRLRFPDAQIRILSFMFPGVTYCSATSLFFMGGGD
eukprot:PhF_6_TR44196/c0_g1_i3/m.67810